MMPDTHQNSSFQWRNGNHSNPKWSAEVLKFILYEFLNLPVEITTAHEVSLVHLIVN